MPSGENDKTKEQTSTDPSKDGNLLRDFAHEIRTPLNAMLGYTQLIESTLAPDCDIDQIADYNATVKTATTQLLHICERVLNDVVSGVSEVRIEKVDARQMALDVTETFGALARERGVTLVCDFPDNFPVLMTDQLLLSQVLSNLVSNAVKFTPSGGMVKVKGEISYAEEAFLFVIQDSGKGIPADLLFRIRRGEQVSMANDHGLQGWGRGLKIVLDICEKIGAELRFEAARGGGTVALISLPFKS
ncbi:MAG: HAMP domain-containing sensor histidine kinase [Rhodospirillales bacterium]